MNIALWIVAGVFAVAYVVGGTVKLTWDYERYAAATHWAEDFTPGKVRFMGVVEIIGGLGLVVPAVLDDTAFLVPVAASGMALYMAGACTERIRRDEYKEFIGDLAFLAVMMFVAWGRFGPEQFG